MVVIAIERPITIDIKTLLCLPGKFWHVLLLQLGESARYILVDRCPSPNIPDNLTGHERWQKVVLCELYWW